MRRNHLPPLLSVLFVTLLVACNKTEVSTTELEEANSMKSPAQAVETLPVASSEAAAITDLTYPKQTEENAVTMANGLALAQKNNCLACHKIDEKLIGPAWRDVAKKYKGVVDIEHKLIIIVSTGGAGNWGNMPMPAMAPAVKEEDIRTLVKFILSLDK